MCRIAGIINNRLPPELIRDKVKAMCNALKHGGPDDEGIFVDTSRHLAFGHRRLSLIDLSSRGHQPMSDVSQKAWITFNGEIYNYLELRDELQKLQIQFHSATDTEVIIQAYLTWGTAAFSKMRGMFSFALYDSVNAKTYLVRDSAAVKPLYYFINEGAISFSSEIRAFCAGGITTEKDANWPVRFLAFGHIPEPFTTLKGVLSLPKGNYLCWDHATSTASLKSYKERIEKSTINDFHMAKSVIKDLLQKSVSRQMMADAPIGVFLSGGLDSSLITVLANQVKLQQLKTISIFFNEKNYDEHAFQRIISDQLKDGQSFSHLVNNHDFDHHFSQIIDAMDMPTTDGINTWFISKYAHDDGLKAVLSGLGADEYFGGYPSLKRIKYLGYLRKFHPSFLSAINSIVPDPYKKIAFLTNESAIADYLFLRGLFSLDDISRILDISSKEVERILFMSHDIPDLGPYNELRASWFETHLYMQNQLLRDTDVMSMNHALEVRVPFLDEDFTSAVESISPQIRFSTHQTKKLLIDSFEGLLPPAIWNRPKMGFSFPLQSWMRQHKEISNIELYSGRVSKNIIKKFITDKIHWSKAFALYQIQGHV
jgi:asparagine synthase (glutamine-hydrolysing)